MPYSKKDILKESGMTLKFNGTEALPSEQTS